MSASKSTHRRFELSLSPGLSPLRKAGTSLQPMYDSAERYSRTAPHAKAVLMRVTISLMPCRDNSTLMIEIAGLSQGTEYDWLNINGTAEIDGTLSISLLNGFTPDAADNFTILSATSLNGYFANGSDHVKFSQGSFDVSYTGNSIMLSNFSAVPEPSSIMLIISAIAGLISARKRKR
ncbi:MAG: PEP-CTERM sorting domain-containing protein [Pirellulaceae bacterium]